MADRNRPVVKGMLASAQGRMRTPLTVIGLVAVVVLITFSVVMYTQRSDLAEGTPDTPAQRPGTPPATPAVIPPENADGFPRGSLPAMLALAPDLLDDSGGLPIKATYADVAGLLKQFGVDPRTSSSDELSTTLAPLEIPEVLESRGLSNEWRDVYGYDLRQVDQILTVGYAPNQIVIMPGRYDTEALYETWVRHGYQAVEVEDTTIWSLSPGDQIDLSAPASRPALGLMNNVVLLDDGTLVASSRQSRLAEVLQVLNGDDPSLYDHEMMNDAVNAQAAFSPLSVVIADGNLLYRPEPTETRRVRGASSQTSGTPADPTLSLPEVEMVLFGFLPAGREQSLASTTMTMTYDDSVDDTASIPHLVERRVRENEVWSQQYRLDAVAVTGEDANMVEVRMTGIQGEITIEDLEQRGLAPFTWTEDD